MFFIGKRDEDLLDVIKITVEENPYPQNYKGDYHFVKIGVFSSFLLYNKNIMDAIKDILSEFIDKKELIKGLVSKIQSAIFLDKLKESNTVFLSQRAHEPYIPCQPKNFEIKFYLPDYFDNYNTNKPARMYIRTINGVMPYLKLLVKIYTDTGIIPKVVELYQFGFLRRSLALVAEDLGERR